MRPAKARDVIFDPAWTRYSPPSRSEDNRSEGYRVDNQETHVL